MNLLLINAILLGNIGVIGLLLENEADILVYDKVIIFFPIFVDKSM